MKISSNWLMVARQLADRAYFIERRLVSFAIRAGEGSGRADEIGQTDKRERGVRVLFDRRDPAFLPE
ncbi:MAG: hypothetical protein ACJ8AJ_07845 [Gemmatimonadaceae bacterium]